MESLRIDAQPDYDFRRDRRLAGCSLAVVVLAICAASDQTQGFYTFLRIYICGLASVLALFGWRRGGAWLPLSAAILAILFNPVRPIEMTSATWRALALCSAVWFFLVGAWPLVQSYWRLLTGVVAVAALVGALAMPLSMKIQIRSVAGEYLTKPDAYDSVAVEPEQTVAPANAQFGASENDAATLPDVNVAPAPYRREQPKLVVAYHPQDNVEEALDARLAAVHAQLDALNSESTSTGSRDVPSDASGNHPSR